METPNETISDTTEAMAPVAPPPAADEGAQDQTVGTEQSPQGPDPETPPQPLWSNPLLWIAVIIWLWVLFSGRKQKKKQAERKATLDSIKTGDHVVTIGRWFGVVVGIDAETVTLKPDKNANGTIRIEKSAIAKVNPEKEEKKDA